MASKQFKIVLAGDAKGATGAIKDAQKAGDGLVSASDGWGGKWAGVFSRMGEKITSFASRFGADTSGMQSRLTGLADGGGAALGGLGDRFGGFGAAAAAGVAVAGMALVGLASLAFQKAQEIAGYLYGLGEQFYTAIGKIRVGTGATGAELDALSESFYNVYEKTTKGSGEVAAAMTLVEQKLNTTGKPLEDLTLGFLRLSSLTGTDVTAGITAVGRVFGDWGVVAEDQLATQDKLFRAWQESGVPIDQLTGTMVQYGASLRGLGYSFDDALAMTSKWNEEGVNTELVMGGLRKAFAVFSKEYGPNAQGEFKKFMDQIANAENPSAAAQIAMGKLGVKIGADFAAAVGEGRFAYGDFMDTIADGDTMAQAAKDTGNWRSSITMMVHTLEAKLGPVAERVFGLINDVIRNNIMPLFRGLSAAWDEGGLAGVFESLPAMFGLVQIKLGEWWETFKTWLGEKWPEIMEGAGVAIRAGLEAGGALMTALGDMLVAVGDWFQSTAWPYIQDHWGEWWKSFTDSFNEGGFMNTAISKLNEFLWGIGTWIVTDALPWAGAKSLEILWALTKWLGTDGIPTLVQGLGTLLGAGIEWIETSGASWVADGARGLWNGIVNSFVSAINTIIDIWNGLSFDVPSIDAFGVTVGGQTVGSPDIGRIVQSSVTTQGTVSGSARRGDPLKGFADGGVVTRPTFALIGEDPRTTPEVVSPLATIEQAMRNVVGNGTGGRMVVQVVLDKRVLGEVMVDTFRGREMALR